MWHAEEDFRCVCCLQNQAVQDNGGLCADCAPPLHLTRHKIGIHVLKAAS